MPHPTEGVLRRLLDEPSGVPEPDRLHVAQCAQCSAALTDGQEAADHVAALLAPPPVDDLDLDAAWARLSTGAPTSVPRRTGRPRRRLRRPAAAALAVAVALAGAGTAAANDWLQVFRTEQVAPLGITTADLVALPDLSAYGDVAFTDEPDVHEVPDAATAEAETGLDLPEVADLPRGVRGAPTYQVGGKVSATFTFSAARASQTAGQALPPPPPGLDGSSVRLDAGPGAAQIWSSGSGAPALIVARAVAPTAFSSGVPFETVRDYLLSLPGLPKGVAEQLRTFAADGSTLPLPVPADQVTTTQTEIGGRPATVLVTRDRFLAGVVWVQDGVLTVVAGALDDSEVLTVARELR